MNIQIITVGKLKETYLTDGCKEYLKRLTPFASCKILELDEARVAKDPSDKEIATALAKEADTIEKRLQKGSYRIACCIEGTEMDSRAFADLLQKGAEVGGAAIDIIIGSSHGLDPRIKSMCHKRFSMSPMTFPHQLFRLMLLEQIYRGFQINAGTKYHK